MSRENYMDSNNYQRGEKKRKKKEHLQPCTVKSILASSSKGLTSVSKIFNADFFPP